MLFGVAFALAGTASAHATVVSSDPIDGSRLKSAPSLVTITFDEAVGLGSVGYLHVTDQSGRTVDAGAAYHPGGDGTKIADKLKAGLGDGTYAASYRVISADSHPVAGTVRFVVGNGVLGAASAAGASVDHTTNIVFDIARWMSFVGLALLVGSWLVLAAWPQGRADRRARQIVWTGLGVATLAALGELVLQGPYTAGTRLSTVTTWPLLDGTLHTDYGYYHCVRLVLLGAVALLLGRLMQGEDIAGRRGSWAEGAVGAVLLGALAFTFAAVGHPATTAPHWLSITDDMLHISAMATWVGGLIMLLLAVLPRSEPDDVQVATRVFSPVALTCVVVLAVTGSYAAWRGVGTIHAIFTTTYGWLVVLKVVLFIGLVAVANFSRLTVQRRGLRVAETERLRRAVIVEIALAVGVLIATSVLVAQPRGKEALAVVHLRPRSASAALGGGRTVRVTIDPGTHGTVATTVEVSAGVPPTVVTATATLPAKQIGPIDLGLTANGPELYGSSGVVLPAAGDWVITLVVATSAFDATTTAVTIHLY